MHSFVILEKNMELECTKYKEAVSGDNPVCRHPDDYCQYRNSCIVQFMEKENRRASSKTVAGQQEKRDVS